LNSLLIYFHFLSEYAIWNILAHLKSSGSLFLANQVVSVSKNIGTLLSTSTILITEDIGNLFNGIAEYDSTSASVMVTFSSNILSKLFFSIKLANSFSDLVLDVTHLFMSLLNL
jgi:hypothetical protein